MSRIQPVTIENANPETAQLLEGVKKKMGVLPNIIATMANSPAVANAYLGMSGTLSQGSLSSGLREQIALTVAQDNSCDYCLAAHSAISKGAGLSAEEIRKAREGSSEDSKAAAAIEFARKLTANRGDVTDEELNTVREAGYTDGEVGEIVANVALNIFTNYFNHVSDPEIDFPKAAPLE